MIYSKHRQFFAIALVALALGSLLFAACARPGTTSSTTKNGSSQGPTSSASEPEVHLGPSTFLQSSVNVPKGSMLKLIDDVQVPHIIKNGSWDSSGNQQLAQEPGAPTVNSNLNGNSADIGPFTTAGTFHLLCTIHAGMNLTVVVQ